MLAPSTPFYPTASELHIARECVAPWSLGLPEAPNVPNEAMKRGSEGHAIAERIANGEAVATSEPWIRAMVEMLDIDHAMAEPRGSLGPPTLWAVERGIALRIGFGGVEAEFVERRPGERLRRAFAGTVDLAYVRADGVLVLADWKFGEYAMRLGETAENHTQLWFLALAFAAVLKLTASSASTIIARVEVRHVSDTGIIVDGYDITQGELDAFEASLDELDRQIRSGHLSTPRRSQACGRCRARASCPAWEQLETSLLASIDSEALARPPATDEEALLMRHAIERTESMAAIWAEQYRAYLITRPQGIPVGLGLTEKAILSTRRAVLDTPESIEVIERIAGESAIVAKKSATIATIKAAVRERAGVGIVSRSDRKKAQDCAEREVFGQLGALGAVQASGGGYVIKLVRSDGESEIVEGDV